MNDLSYSPEDPYSLTSTFMDEMAAKAFRVSSFTAAGHLLHINLKDNLLQHKNQIGEALLKSNPRALAVVNKINTIDNTYRNFEIEIIAKRDGCEKTDDELMIVEVKENRCRFQLDFSKVYWNSRLGTEHERIIAKFHKPCDIVFDLFAGVGPFAVPAAKAKCKTYANDLNPESFKWLELNMRLNKVRRCCYELYNMDAKDFILDHLKTNLIQEYKRVEDEELATKPKIHILMNLPALATTFLPHFIGLLNNDGAEKITLNNKNLIDLFREQQLEHVIYCYCFLKGMFDDPKVQVKNMVQEHFGKELEDDQIIEIFRVRNVAPYKEMYRVDIKLDERILFGTKNIVGIMKSQGTVNRLSLNGTTKKVTIQDQTPTLGKRSYEGNADTPGDGGDNGVNDSKKAKVNDYCSVI